MFLDETIIEVMAGRGGNGLASFRREKYIPKGGPDGGDGGDGGNIYLEVKEDIHGLAKLAAGKKFLAPNGETGRSKKQHGANGKDVIISVPPGTLVWSIDKSPDPIVDMATMPKGRFLIARGGRGGLGNVHFASATNRAPRQFSFGEMGQHQKIRLEVRHIADVGLIGLPNAGKSTLISRISAARPKIADYPFTTLEPNLGTVNYKNERFIIADIPGLIAGASHGKGLGHKFLRHLTRTKILVHLIAADTANPKNDYQTIRAELEKFDPELLERTEIVVFSKIDLISKKTAKILDKKLQDYQPLFVSAITGEGLDQLLNKILREISHH